MRWFWCPWQPAYTSPRRRERAVCCQRRLRFPARVRARRSCRGRRSTPQSPGQLSDEAETEAADRVERLRARCIRVEVLMPFLRFKPMHIRATTALRPKPTRTAHGPCLRIAAAQGRSLRPFATGRRDTHTRRLRRIEIGSWMLPAHSARTRAERAMLARALRRWAMNLRRERGRTRRRAVTAGAATLALGAAEVAHVWRRGRAPRPASARELVHGGEIAARETVGGAACGLPHQLGRRDCGAQPFPRLRRNVSAAHGR